MKRHITNWLLLILAAALFHVIFRYWAGNFQGYLTLPIGGTGYGFAHIKTSTVWVSGPGRYTYIPDILTLVFMLGSLAGVVFAVRRVYRNSVQRK